MESFISERQHFVFDSLLNRKTASVGLSGLEWYDRICGAGTTSGRNCSGRAVAGIYCSLYAIKGIVAKIQAWCCRTVYHCLGSRQSPAFTCFSLNRKCTPFETFCVLLPLGAIWITMIFIKENALVCKISVILFVPEYINPRLPLG